ncbi:GlxA family transcriptional regulator [Acuticoccus sediminis]|uniref:GlxA family transcriptional regulator n=1 Tax=Acuticoccus sediminis TaxID=2184697 RepID=UPI001CFE68C4|nr:GlxA family transcriptional regulator [Acuticoccus sediminis]
MRVVILAPPGVQMLDVVGPAEIFWEAARRIGDMSAYDIKVVSTGGPSVPGTGALRLVADGTIEDIEGPIDTLLVAGDPSFQALDPAVTDWLRRVAPTVRRYGSICTGVFLLAAAGLLDGRTVTTHWECADQFRRDYPNIDVDTDAIYLRDGALITAAGVTAGIDLALALVEEDYGRDIAMIVARYMVVFLRRPGGQSQFSAHLVGQMSATSAIQRAQTFILEHLAEPLSVDQIAREAGMSPRNFARVFRREVDMTPAEFVAAARTDAARRHLESTCQSLQQIAVSCGFSDAGTMRRCFSRLLGATPLEYRQRFQDHSVTASPAKSAWRSTSPGGSAFGCELPEGLRAIGQG